MTSVRIQHYTHSKNSDGTSPIIIIVNDGKRKKRTLANILPNQWDESKKRVIPKSHSNYATINIRISNEFNRIELLILSDIFDLQRDFIDYFDNKVAEPVPEKKYLSFAEIVPFYISSLKSGFSMACYESRLKYFIREAKIGNLRSSEITKAHMETFIKFMEDKRNKDGQPTKRSTIRTQLKIVRYLSSYAEKNNMDTKSEAVHNFALPIAERSIKTKLTRDEVAAFKAVKLTDDTKIMEIQDMFLLAIYLRGMRVGDIIQLRQDSFKDGRLVYESGKNKKAFNIKLIPEVDEILSRYLDGRQYVFTFFTWNENKQIRAEQVKSITANINSKLKIIAKRAGITKNISFHIARHTFAKMAIDKVKDFNISMDLTGHSNIKEHQLYIREISETEDLDNAADDIFS